MKTELPPYVLQTIKNELSNFADQFAAQGWDRVHGMRLAQLAGQIKAAYSTWAEAKGRAETLEQILVDFARQPPSKGRLAPIVLAVRNLAELLGKGPLADRLDIRLLPADPHAWTFLAAGEGFNTNADLFTDLRSLDFSVESVADSIDEVASALTSNPQTILLAGTGWLTTHGERIRQLLPKSAVGAFTFPLAVGVADTDDFLTQARARQAGARLLLDAPLDVSRLLAELAGLAWMPRTPYRVLLVDDDICMLAIHTEILRDAGCEVLAVEDSMTAREMLDDFAPDACVLDVEMPVCRGTDLAALLQRNARFARLPILYLSGFDDIEHQLDARHAGGEDYLTKPVEERLLVVAAIARARRYRRVEAIEQLGQKSRRELEELKAALDVHAIVSIAAPDGSIIDANRQFCAVSGYAREELIGRNHRIVRSGHHPAAYFEDMWRTLSAGQIWQGEIQNRHKDGSACWVMSTILPILDEHGSPERYVSIRTDITEQKRVLADRERQGRLLDLVRQALAHFMTSHDIHGTSALLLDGMRLLTDSAYGFIGEVLHDPDGAPYLCSHAITDIAWNDETRCLFDEARAKGMEFRNLATLFGTVLKSGETVIANNPTNDPRSGGLPEGHPPLDAFLGAPIYRGSTLIGMLGLANRHGGYDAALVDFLGPLMATYAVILEASRMRTVQQGIIDELLQSRVSAEQAHQARTEQFAAWVNSLRSPLNILLGHAQLLLMSAGHNPEIREHAEEIRQGGQHFTQLIAEVLAGLAGDATVPKVPAPVIPTTVVSEHKGMRRRILVAEDNPANQAVLRMQLRTLGFDADMAEDGVVALAKWQAGGHDLILADRNMARMDGLELARSIRAAELERGTYIPIIAITALNQARDLDVCRAAGMDDALPKPIELNDLQRILQRWLPKAAPAAARTDMAPATKSEQTGPVLDQNYLTRVVGRIEAKETRDLVDLFTSTVRHDFPACQRHLEASDGGSLALLMHKLKSSARMVGALNFAGVAEKLEEAAKTGRYDAAKGLFVELGYALDDVEAALTRLAVSSLRGEPAEAVSPAPFFPEYSPSQADDAAMSRRALVVDDDPVARRQFELLLIGLGVDDVLTVENGDTALAEIARTDGIDLLITDLNMPGMDGIEFLRRLVDTGYQGGLIIASGVETRLIQNAAELARAKRLRLNGTLKKPATRETLLALMTKPSTSPTPLAPVRPEPTALLPDAILDGIRRDEFEVHFQPKVDVSTLRAVGVEALARWRRAGQPIRPDLFIAAAEQHGLIGQLSEILVTKAMLGGTRLVAAGFPLAVAINLSASWLTDIKLPEFIVASLQATGFPADKLILEITETGVMADAHTALDIMTRLRLKGFKLSIDDFGTGYSSMDQLQRFPFSELKLDRSFVQGATEKPTTRAILAASLEMAIKLKLSTVAEGVETQQDLDLVRGLGCNLVQGWLVAKAMPVEELIAWLRNRGDHI
ncbi:MAG: EAL domain-containing protein [Magnetococcus sp. YQC-9]